MNQVYSDIKKYLEDKSPAEIAVGVLSVAGLVAAIYNNVASGRSKMAYAKRMNRRGVRHG